MHLLFFALLLVLLAPAAHAREAILFTAPYQGAPWPAQAAVETTTGFPRVDLYFNVDRSGSMQAERAALAANLAAIVGQLASQGYEVRTGVGHFDDCGTYANTVAVQADPSLTAAAVAVTSVGTNEAPLQALRCIADPVACGFDPGCDADPTVADPVGCAGYRPDARRVLLHVSDADDQAAAGCDDPTVSQTASAMADAGLVFVGLMNNADDGPAPGFPLDLGRDLAQFSGSVDAQGQPLVYLAEDSGVANAALAGAQSAIEQVPVDVWVEVFDDPSDAVDARSLLDRIEVRTGTAACPSGALTSDEDGDGHPDTFRALVPGSLPGAPVCWNVVPRAINDVVPATAVEQRFDLELVVRAGGVELSRETVTFVVPADVSTSVESGHLAELRLGAPAPNPFSGTTQIALRLPGDAGPVRLTVHDSRGRKVRTLLDGAAVEGNPVWDGRDDDGTRVPAGVYHARLVVGGRTESRKLVLLH